MNSIKPTHIILVTVKLDCLPKANNIPRGKDATIPVTPTIRDKVNPPILRDSTGGNFIGNIMSNIDTNKFEINKKKITTNKIDIIPAKV